MKQHKGRLAVFLALTVALGCEPDLAVPSLNNPVAGGAATRSTIVTGAQGLLVNARAMSTQGVKYQGMWGRESYDLRPEEPLPYQDNMIGPRDPLSSSSGTYFNYGTLVNARAVLEGLQNVSGMTDAEKEGVRGWAKVRPATSTTVFSVTVSDKPNIAAATNSTFPWIRNEELLLIRAEANLALGNLTAALADVNIVRQRSGGLAPLTTTPTAAALLDEILYNKRYSLFWEGGFTYLDAFQYNKLSELPRSLPAHVVFNRLNWPSAECLQRGMTTGACGSVAGIR